MSKTIRLVLKEVELTDKGILITKVSLIESESGEELKIAKLNEQLLDFIKLCEFDMTEYMKIQKMKQENPAFKKLIDTFKLYT